MSAGKNWICPFCNRPQTVTEGQGLQFARELQLHSHRFPPAVGLYGDAIACSNPECGQIQLDLTLIQGTWANGYEARFQGGKVLETYHLRPTHYAKPQPEYIPKPLRDDYLEACKIRDLSPKASATLARRCLQGMIRDFCNIKKKTLFKEIEELKARVTKNKAPQGVSPESVTAIDHVRTIGNIGAHMESNINIIIDVDPGEAQALIELIEALLDEWYVARQKRKETFAKVGKIAAEKKAAKANQSAPISTVETPVTEPEES